MSDPWYRTIPVWYGGTTDQMAAGQHAPDHSETEPPQPGEGPALLPTFAGSHPEQAKENTALVKQDKAPRGHSRRPPYFPLAKPIIYSTTAGVFNVVELGRPNPGFRWILKQIAILPGTTITDTTGGGVTAHFYVGNLPITNAAPALSDWLATLPTTAATVPINSVIYTSSIHIQNTQSLIVLLTGGVNNAVYLPFARVEQISDREVSLETETG